MTDSGDELEKKILTAITGTDRLKQALAWVSELDAIPKEYAEDVARSMSVHWDAVRWRVNVEQVRRLQDEVENGKTSEEHIWYADALKHGLEERETGGAPWQAARIDYAAVETKAGPVFWQDQIGACYLEDEFGATGAKGAEKIRRHSVEHIKAWGLRDQTDKEPQWRLLADLMDLWGLPINFRWHMAPELQRPPRMPRYLALAIWNDEFKPQAERAQRLGTAGLARSVVEQIAGAMVRSTRIEEDAGGAVELLRGHRRAGTISSVVMSEVARRRGLAPGVVDAAIRGMLDAQIRAMRSKTGQLVFRLMVHEAFAKAVSEGLGVGPVEIEFPGGGQEVARRIGLKGSSSQTQEIRNALDGYSLLELPVDGIHGRAGHMWLLRWDDIPARPGQRQVIRVTLNRPLTPYYVNTLPRSDRLITPIPSTSPEMVGRNRDHGPQMLMHLGVFLFLTEHSTELYEKGSVHIGSKDWLRLADEAEVPKVLLDEIRNVYIAPSSRSLFPVFQQVEGTRTRFTLANHLDKEAAFLMEQGERRSRASKDGKASARAKKLGTRRGKPRKS